jgi:multiple sugar transport system substrate-binding protein
MKTRPTTLGRRHRSTIAGAAIGVLTLTAACGSGFNDDEEASDDGGGDSGGGSLEVLFGSSGQAETEAMEAAGAAFTEETGIKVTMTAAQDLTQQVAQGFAAGEPADVFYLDPSTFQNYAADGDLYPYVDQLSAADDFYPVLEETFSYEGEFTCAPKDWGTLGLVINNKMWKEAGLTEADLPTDWDELATLADRLTTDDHAGLVLDSSISTLGSFLYQNGGSILSEDGTEATLDSAANVEALEYVQGLLDDGVAALPVDLDSEWNGEAFGRSRAAMVIIGPWVVGALAADFPGIDYSVYPLQEGPAGPGTVSFTNCWAIPSQTPNQDEAVQLVEFLTSVDQQMTFAEAFGPVPSRMSAESTWTAQFPELAPFVEQAEYAHPDVALAGGTEVIADLNSQLSQIGSADPAELLSNVQANFEDVIEENQG